MEGLDVALRHCRSDDRDKQRDSWIEGQAEPGAADEGCVCAVVPGFVLLQAAVSKTIAVATSTSLDRFIRKSLPSKK